MKHRTLQNNKFFFSIKWDKYFLFYILLSHFFPFPVQAALHYSLSVISQTGDSPGSGGELTSISNRVSINDLGKVAFLGITASGGSLFVGDEFGKTEQISFPLPSTTRIYSPGIQINNDSKVIARDRSGSTNLIRLWDADNPGVFETVVRGNIDGGTSAFPAAFDSVFGYPTLSNHSEGIGDLPFVAFSALDSTLGTVLSSPIDYSTYPDVFDTSKSNFNKTPTITPLRPSIADNGQIVIRHDSSGSIRVYDNDLSTFQDIATSADFSVLGRASGISDDGKIVVFYGKRHSGEEGIFASLLTPSGRDIIQISGVSENGILEEGETYTDSNGNGKFDSDTELDIGPFSGYFVDEKVALTSTNHTQGHVLVAFKAIDAVDGKEGVYSNRIFFYGGENMTTPDVFSSNQVVKQGDNINSELGDIDIISLHDSINIHGQIAFHATTTTGMQAVIIATKLGEVVNVVTHGFNPGLLPWESFRKPWYDLAATLNNIPLSSSINPSSGNIKTYVSEWESKEGFLPAFLSVFVAKFSDAKAQQLESSVLPADLALAILLKEVSEVLKGVAITAAEKSAKHAEFAAENIYHDLAVHWLPSGSCIEPTVNCDLNKIEKIHLIGHSRGAAVNARVSKKLVAAGFNVVQVTALDGFSTDWPEAGVLIGDIDIDQETSVRTGGRKINYRVEQGIAEYAASSADVINQNLILKTLYWYLEQKYLLVPSLDPEFLALLSSYDLRAPERPSFEQPNPVFQTTGAENDPSADDKCKGESHHLNITQCYLYSDKLKEKMPNYIRNDFIGVE